MSSDTSIRIFPLRGHCYECGGTCERLAYETHRDSGVGMCLSCAEDLNRPTKEELAARGDWDDAPDES